MPDRILDPVTRVILSKYQWAVQLHVFNRYRAVSIQER